MYCAGDTFFSREPMDLFHPKAGGSRAAEKDAPLAARMRPRTPEEFVGQSHFFGEGRLLRRAIKADRLRSAIFYGPPGSGKTALAHVIAGMTESEYEEVNASLSNVAELREILAKARDRKELGGKRTVLFVDEIHRFNRAQQDILLSDVECGNVVLIGATTYNPFFAINAPLISRSMVFEFRPLSREEVRKILDAALSDEERGLGGMHVEAEEEALGHLAEVCDGDARRALNALEIGVLSASPDEKGVIRLDVAAAEESIQRKAIRYGRLGDEHYDAASAFIKSMRGSDPDAAVYWMARMLEAGEDHRFIARRIVICASEDVGNADPMALVVAAAALQGAEFVGLPEAKLILSQAAIYVACAEKSNAACAAISRASEDVREGRLLEVPEHLRDASYRGAKRLGHGEGYKYAHDYEGHWVDQEYVPKDVRYYEPSESGYEKKIRERLEEWRKRRRERRSQKR